MINYFLQTLQHLRQHEEVLLYNNLLHATAQQQQEAAVYLAEEYQRESINYPFGAPAFNPPAALWAARTVYTASQLMLYREQGVAELEGLLPEYDKTIDAAAVLSADLLLRFLPSIISQLNALNPDDKLIRLLLFHLTRWHYSGVPWPLPVHDLRFEAVVCDKCLYQLYIDRVIENKRLPLAQHPLLTGGVHASLGMFAAVYWKEFQQQGDKKDERK